MTKIPCPATYREMLVVLLGAQFELLARLDITRGCGAPTPDTEKAVLDEIGRFATATALAATLRGQDHLISPTIPAAAVEAMDPDRLYSGLINACGVLQTLGAFVPEGLTVARIASIETESIRALSEIGQAVDDAFDAPAPESTPRP